MPEAVTDIYVLPSTFTSTLTTTHLNRRAQYHYQDEVCFVGSVPCDPLLWPGKLILNSQHIAHVRSNECVCRWPCPMNFLVRARTA